MPGKRKASRQSRPSAVEIDDSRKYKLNIRSFEDVADSEDEFHINRDKILLDQEPARKRQRKIEEQGMR